MSQKPTVFFPPFSSGNLVSTITQIFNKDARPKTFVTLTEKGFTLTLPGIQEHPFELPFEKCRNVYATAIYHVSEKGYKAFYACYFIELFRQDDANFSIFTNTRNGSIPFIATPTDFSNFIGVPSLAGIYLNPGDEGPDIDQTPFFKAAGFELKRLRPIMQVESVEKYNEMIDEYIDQSFHNEYKL